LTMEMTGSGSMLKLHALNCPGTSPGGSCGCYILSDPQNGCSTVTSAVQWTQGNTIELTDPYGTHYSPQYPVSRPLPIPNGPPLPPPRSPIVAGSHTGTLRRANTYRPNDGEQIVSDGLDHTTQTGYPDSHMNYGQMNGPTIGSTSNGTNDDYEHDHTQTHLDMDNTHGTGPPVRIDLRQSSQERNGTLNETDQLTSKSRVRLAHMGLPPLASKSGMVSTNGTDERVDNMERDPLNATGQ
uniref:Teneurin-2 n=1 Tax=Echinostoma caproni TaxID=27848 RepID=A0A183A394_9TREM